MLKLIISKRTDKDLLARMATHYSQPKGFVGRNICYAVWYDEKYYGHIVFGSATKHLQGRHSFLETSDKELNKIANNIFYNVTKVDGKYPKRNFTSFVLVESLKRLKDDWLLKYGDCLVGVETLVEKPRTGELYLKAGFSLVGETKGFTCKRVAGKGTDNWSGRRVWNTNPEELRPKLILCKKISSV